MSIPRRSRRLLESYLRQSRKTVRLLSFLLELDRTRIGGLFLGSFAKRVTCILAAVAIALHVSCSFALEVVGCHPIFDRVDYSLERMNASVLSKALACSDERSVNER